MSAAHEAFILMDPVQDWEESDILHGVFGSLKAAQLAARQVQYDRSQYDKRRLLAVQHWVGTEHRATWEYAPHGHTGRKEGWREVRT